MNRYVCIRDDDANFFTAPAELRKAYGENWGRIPLTLAVIPFVHGSDAKILEPGGLEGLLEWEKSASPEELERYNALHPAGDNEALAKELSGLVREGKVEIAQHGLTHRYASKGPELMNGFVPAEKIQEGRRHLEETFKCRVGVFIPPGNMIDERQTLELKKLKLNMFSSWPVWYPSVRRRALSYIRYPGTVADVLSHRLLGNTSPVRNYCGVKTIHSIIFDTYDDAAAVFALARAELEKTGFTAIATHYRHLLKDGNAGKFAALLRRLGEIEGVKFVTASEYIQKASGK